MGYADRVKLYARIEELRDRPLVVYVTSPRANAGGEMAADAIPEVIDQLRAVDATATAIDMLVVSNGGDPLVSWRIVSLLRERFKKIGALLPYAAFSAATLLAMGADEIVMHPFSNLGPVDPQLRMTGSDGQQTQFGAEDLRHFLEFVRSDVGVSDQEQLERAFELVCKEVGAIPIGIAKRSAQFALSMGEKMLSLHMGDANKAKAIAEALNRSFYHHGYPLGRTEARKEVGLPVSSPDAELEEAMWAVWKSFEQEMRCGEPFDPVAAVMADPQARAALTTVPQVQIPANLPQQIQEQVIQKVLQQVQIAPVPPVDYDLMHASVESARCGSAFTTKGSIMAVRRPDMAIAVSVTKSYQGWTQFTPAGS